MTGCQVLIELMTHNWVLYITFQVFHTLIKQLIIYPVIVGAVISCAYRAILTKMNIARMYPRAALIAKTSVTLFPLSNEIAEPICFYPFRPKIRDGLCTVVMPLSSTLYIRSA